MTKQLYEEALADVKKLKEVAEDNAKRALLEAVTPRIRDLIENQLMGSGREEEIAVDDDTLLLDNPGGLEDEMAVSLDEPLVGDENVEDIDTAVSPPDEEGKVTLDLDALTVPGKPGQYELSMESARSLGILMNAKGSSSVSSFEKKLLETARKLNAFAKAKKIIGESAGYSAALESIKSRVEDMYSYLQINLKDAPKKRTYESILESYYSTLKQLTEQKMKRIKTLSESDVTLKLTGLPDEVDLDSVGVDLITGEGGDEDEDEFEGGDEEEGGDDLDLGDEEEGDDEEGGDEEEGSDDELDLDLGDEEEEQKESHMESRRLSNNTIVEIDEGMLRREISRMRALREADETKPQSWGNGPGEVSDDFEDDDLGDPFVDVDLTTEADDKEEDVKEMDELDELDELDQDDMKQYSEADEDVKEMDELDELEVEADDKEEDKGDGEGGEPTKQSAQMESLRRRLRAEARIQAEAKQKAQGAKKQGQQKQKESQQKQKEAQQKQKESKQKQNEAQQKQKQGQKTQAQQKQKESQQKQKEAQQKQKEAQQKKQQAKKMQEAYSYYARIFNESVTRSNRLRGLLAEASARQGRVLNGASSRSAAETSNLRSKLAETNLFNAKLLFTNKLLQNESLTKRQKASIIERLDEARSEREVKLVYESLTKTLQASSAKLNETVERGVIGSSSRAARPAAASNATSTLNEGYEADRWARLAGIVK